MPTIKAVDLINRVSVTLQDPTFVRWTQQELLTYLNDAQRQIVAFRPDARAVGVTLTCVASAKQTLPADATRLINVIRNRDGRAITKIDRATLDVQLPTWFEAPISDDGIKHFVYDAADPKTFYVYPKPTTSNQIEIVYSAPPAEIVISNFGTDTTTITLDDIYANAIMDYMAYRAYQKDSEFANLNRAGAYYQSFAQGIGVKTQSEGSIQQNMDAQQPGRSQ